MNVKHVDALDITSFYSIIDDTTGTIGYGTSCRILKYPKFIPSFS